MSTDTKDVPSLTVTTRIGLDRIGDLLCCAFEGGVGYWCTIVKKIPPAAPVEAWKVRAFAEDLGKPQGNGHTVYPHIEYPVNGGSLVLRAEDDPKRYTLDMAAIERGLAVMAEKYPKHFADFVAENDDAETADVFLQCCLFGEIVYG